MEPCPPEAREAALQVLYQRIPDSLRSRLVVEVLQEASCGQVDLSGLWVAWDRCLGLGTARFRIIGTLLTQALAGRAAAIWAPEVLPSWRRATTAAALVRSALADLQARGFRIVQAVLDESASRRGAIDLIRGGMPRVTELLYLERDTHLPLPESVSLDPLSESEAIPPRLIWHPFNAARETEFRALLQATYTSSLDMPELEGVRSLDDIIEGHRSTGRFVPDRWRLGQVPGEPDTAVVLLLSEVPDRDVWEVVYLGLTVSRAAVASVSLLSPMPWTLPDPMSPVLSWPWIFAISLPSASTNRPASSLLTAARCTWWCFPRVADSASRVCG